MFGDMNVTWSTTLRPTRLTPQMRDSLSILFVAKHALGDGRADPEDGNHAIYHREIRDILENLGLNLHVAATYDALFAHPGVDFVFPLLNRGGFLNSEMLLPLLCTRLGIPFLGASPILRGLSDDKHLSKRVATARGVPTASWAIFRRGAPVNLDACPPAKRWVIKPNASSASWGVSDAFDRANVGEAVAALHTAGHDVIVEPFLEGNDIEVPVITIGGEPIVLPPMVFEQADPTQLRSYDEKRDLVDHQTYWVTPLADSEILARVTRMTRWLWDEYRPFDYGRFEFRHDPRTGEVRFLEQNTNCNLWSQKLFAQSARRAGLAHEELIETILAESLYRHGLIGMARARPMDELVLA